MQHLFISLLTMLFISVISSRFFGQGKFFYVISDERANSDEAQSICKQAGGTLAEIVNMRTKNRIIDIAENRLLGTMGRGLQISIAVI